ncbi:MAG: alpha/beta hydrolase [Bacteroidetes bacterium]|nr:alpha/beta hydrolase [Bacteroidota bacterium]
MKHTFKDAFAPVNKIDLHYIAYENELPKILLLHGLTANAFAFQGLVNAGLTDHFSVISIDQRGRGLSTKPAFAYSIREHALDVIGLLDELEIDNIILGGHSFGGLLSTYLAYHFPDRVSKTIILDAAPEMNPNTPQMLAAALGRIDKRYENFNVFIEEVKKAPYLHFWDEAMLTYYKADIAHAEDGSVEPRSNLADIIQIAKAVSETDWETCFKEMKQASVMMVAIDDYTLNQPLLPTFKAKEILAKMQQASYHEIPGNHQTMLYGKGAHEIVNAMKSFALK